DDQFAQRLGLELGAGLLRVGDDVAEVELGETRPRDGDEVAVGAEEHVDRTVLVRALLGRRSGRDERPDAAAEAGALGCGRHQTMRRWAISDAASRYESDP